jgi:hypothetical protein
MKRSAKIEPQDTASSVKGSNPISRLAYTYPNLASGA